MDATLDRLTGNTWAGVQDFSQCSKILSPVNDQTVFGGAATTSALGTMNAEGNVYRNIGNAIAGNGTDTADDIVGGCQIPAGAFDALGRGLNITAQGNIAANAHAKRYKLWVNPTMSGQTVNADGSISGGTVSAAGSGFLLLDSGIVSGSGSIQGWSLNGNLFKYGAKASNTQYFQGSVINQTSHGGVTSASFTTLSEAGVINIVVTASSPTSGAANDVVLNFIEVNGMN
jgi:hypothetical protein